MDQNPRKPGVWAARCSLVVSWWPGTFWAVVVGAARVLLCVVRGGGPHGHLTRLPPQLFFCFFEGLGSPSFTHGARRCLGNQVVLKGWGKG